MVYNGNDIVRNISRLRTNFDLIKLIVNGVIEENITGDSLRISRCTVLGFSQQETDENAWKLTNFSSKGLEKIVLRRILSDYESESGLESLSKLFDFVP